MSVCTTAEDLYWLVKSNQHIELSGDVSIAIYTESPSTSHSVDANIENFSGYRLSFYGFAESDSWWDENDQQYFTSLTKEEIEMDYKFHQYCNSILRIIEFLEKFTKLEREELVIKLYSTNLCKYMENNCYGIVLAVANKELRIFGELD